MISVQNDFDVNISYCNTILQIDQAPSSKNLHCPLLKMKMSCTTSLMV
jgi:hypothetical protein